MATIRARLATAYSAALAGTLAIFAGSLWVARGAAGYRELQRYVNEEAEVAAKLLAQARGPGVPDGLPLVEVRDPLVGPLVVPRVRLLLDALPNFVFVADRNGRIVYGSFEARLLTPGGASGLDSSAALLSPQIAGIVEVRRDSTGVAGANVRARRLPLREEVLAVKLDLPPELAPLRRVVVATPTRSAQRARQELFGAMLAVAPVVLALSAGAGWWIAGRAVRPLGRMLTDVEAITDGRSLHRRLAMGEADPERADELARLAATLNAMIGRLETSFGALRRFTADASHELKTPLTVLRATVERAMAAPAHSGDQYVALEEALQETTRMAALVDSLLTLARFDEGRFDIYREPVPLEPLVHDVAETAHILGEAAGLRISVSALDPATVQGDATRLRQLFLNLVTNAIKYTPAGGEVELALRRVDASITFSVRDTGIGIAAADLPYIFDRFWRADRARSRRPGAADAVGERGGFGLGLAISQWIAQAHGGQIAVVSRLTRGSTFTVTLPIGAAAPVGAADGAVGAPGLADDAPVSAVTGAGSVVIES